MIVNCVFFFVLYMNNFKINPVEKWRRLLTMIYSFHPTKSQLLFFSFSSMIVVYCISLHFSKMADTPLRTFHFMIPKMTNQLHNFSRQMFPQEMTQPLKTVKVS